MLEKASKIEQNFINKKEFHLGFSSEINLDGKEDGIIFMTMEEEKLGEIVSCNLTASSMFGFYKSDLISKNVNML